VATPPKGDDGAEATIARQPTGPTGLPLVGHLIQFKQDPLKLLNEVRTHGDLVRLQFGPKIAFVVNHPELIEDVLATRHGLLVKTSGRKFTRLSRLLSGSEQIDRVVHFPADADEEFWSRERPTLQPVFANSQVSRYVDQMMRVIQDFIDDWKSGETRDIYREMVHLTFRIVGRTMFGSDDWVQEQKLLAAFEVILSAVVARIANPLQLPVIVPTTANRRLVRAVQEINAIFDALVRQRAQAAGTGDLIDIMLEGDRLHHADWRYNVLSIFIAGYETSAVALTWIWYLLARHPDVAGKVQSEIDRVIGGRVAEEKDVHALVYTEAVVKEALRLYPPLWVTAREARKDFALRSVRVPAGSILMISPWVTHRDARFYVDPDAFRPERWLTPGAGQLPKYAYFPFSAGPRHCLGQRFATLEIMLAVATIASRFTLTALSQKAVLAKPGIGLRPAGAVPMVVARRAK
jgi:cytochrome P450